MCCRDCADFTQDPIGFGFGIGKCASYEAGMASNPSKAAIRQARMIRGNYPEYDLFYGGTGKRDCKRFTGKKIPTDPGKGSVGFIKDLTTGIIVNE